jgi:RNA polymerase sigma-70 factor, ECF subfamily
LIYFSTVAGLRRKQLHHEIPRTFYITESERWNDMPSHIEQELEISNFSEEDTIRLAQEGNATGFEQLYRRYSRRVYSICFRIVKNDSDAEDMTQEAFLLLFRKIHTFRGESKFSTWLHRLTVNVVLMRLRKKRYPEVSLDATVEPGEEDSAPLMELGGPDLRLNGVVDQINLSRAIEQLPDGYKKMFILHDVEGFEHHEIAKILGCSSGNSKSQLYKARVRLRELLQEALRDRAREKRLSTHRLPVSEHQDDRFQCAKA